MKHTINNQQDFYETLLQFKHELNVLNKMLDENSAYLAKHFSEQEQAA